MKVEIQKPCTQNWGQMIAAGERRYCDACRKHVHDFTSFTDEQLISFLQSRKNEKVCGRLDQRQLNRELFDGRTSKSFAARVAALFIASATVLKLPAQQKDECGTIIEHPSGKQIKQTQIRGIVVDRETLEPVPFAAVSVKSNKNTVTTNIDGQFCIDVPTLSDSLIVISVGYERRFVSAATTDTIKVELQSHAFMGEVIMTIAPQKRLAGKIKSLFRKKRKEEDETEGK